MQLLFQGFDICCLVIVNKRGADNVHAQSIVLFSNNQPVLHCCVFHALHNELIVTEERHWTVPTPRQH